MLLTEEQARGKWCPHARYVNGDEPSANRWALTQGLHTDPAWALNPSSCRCIASECASWRWHEGLAEMPDGSFWQRTDASLSGVNVSREDAVGYCGLAGRP